MTIELPKLDPAISRNVHMINNLSTTKKNYLGYYFIDVEGTEFKRKGVLKYIVTRIKDLFSNSSIEERTNLALQKTLQNVDAHLVVVGKKLVKEKEELGEKALTQDRVDSYLNSLRILYRDPRLMEKTPAKAESLAWLVRSDFAGIPKTVQSRNLGQSNSNKLSTIENLTNQIAIHFMMILDQLNTDNFQMRYNIGLDAEFVEESFTPHKPALKIPKSLNALQRINDPFYGYDNSGEIQKARLRKYQNDFQTDRE